MNVTQRSFWKDVNINCEMYVYVGESTVYICTHSDSHLHTPTKELTSAAKERLTDVH